MSTIIKYIILIYYILHVFWYVISVIPAVSTRLYMLLSWKAYVILISVSLLQSDVVFQLLQNDKDVFMESLICRLDDNCDKLLICKLDLECQKTLHFDSEFSMPQVSICNLDHSITFFVCVLVCFPENNLNLLYFLPSYYKTLQHSHKCRLFWLGRSTKMFINHITLVSREL